MDREPFVYLYRVRYADTDQMGVVYHARYLEWFEAARTEMLRGWGISYKELEEKGIALPVVEVRCRYRMPVRYDEEVEIHTRLNEATRSKILIAYEVSEAGTRRMRASGYTLHCYLSREGKPVRAPHWLETLFLGHVSKDEEITKAGR